MKIVKISDTMISYQSGSNENNVSVIQYGNSLLPLYNMAVMEFDTSLIFQNETRKIQSA